MELIPKEDEITPITKTIIDINLKKTDFLSDLNPKHPHKTYAAAKGAVIELVNPAENKPKAIISLEKFP